MTEVQESGTRRKIKLTYIVTAVAISCLMVGASLGIIISGTTPSIPTVIEPGSMVSGYSYVIFQSGSDTYAKNGTTGAISYSGTSASAVIQSAINQLNATGGGSIFIKKATYILTTKVLLGGSHFHIEAETGTIFSSSLMPCFEIDGAWPVPAFNGIAISDIQLINLAFYYTGTIHNGDFIRIANLLHDFGHEGQILLQNIQVSRDQNNVLPDIYANITTNEFFVALKLQNINGATFNDISIINFGTGLMYNATVIPLGQGSTNTFNHVTVSFCFNGVYSGVGGDTSMIWNNMKIMCITGKGWIASSIEAEIHSSHFEAIPADVALFFQGHSLLVDNSIFSSVYTGYAIWLKDWGVNGTSHALVQNSYFTDMYTAIRTEMDLTLIGNSYHDITVGPRACIVKAAASGCPVPTVISFNDQWMTRNSGIAYINGTNTTVFQHGLSSSSTNRVKLVLASFNSTATGTYKWKDNGATSYNYYEIDLTVQNIGYYTVYWYAEI